MTVHEDVHEMKKQIIVLILVIRIEIVEIFWGQDWDCWVLNY